MKKVLFVSLATMALTACGGGATDADADGDGEVTATEARAATQAAGANLKPEPGKYKSTMTFVTADIPGLPEEAKGMMGSNMNFSSEFCMTQEMADEGFEQAAEQGQQGDCSMSKYEIDGSDVSMEMACKQPGAGDMNVSMQGTVTPTRSEFDVTTKGEIPQFGEAEFTMSMVQERIGDCD
ncbi:MAG: DUF3617 domain-containing protein [Pseudomonadota bacterium]